MEIAPIFQKYWPAWGALAGWHGRFWLAGGEQGDQSQLPLMAAGTRPWLTAREQERLDGLGCDKRRRQWLGGRFAAKQAAAGLFGQPADWSEIGIDSEADGRPTLVRPGQRAWVSISHSGSAVAAVVAESLCGLDVQQPEEALLRVRPRFVMAEEEVILTSLLPACQPLLRLALLWAAKEAVRKAVPSGPLPGMRALRLLSGEGIASPPNPLMLTLLVPAPPGADWPIRVLAWQARGLAWAICLNQHDVVE